MNLRRKKLLLFGAVQPFGLLNTFFGTGAAAAYSLRMLNADIIGEDIIEVKRVANSDFDRFKLTKDGIPQAQIASFCGASDGIVSWLQDQSGNQRAVSQTAESACPFIYENGQINRINGSPALRFAGAQTLNRSTFTQEPSAVVFYIVLRNGDGRFFSYGAAARQRGNYGDLGSVGLYARLDGGTDIHRIIVNAGFLTQMQQAFFTQAYFLNLSLTTLTEMQTYHS